MATSVLGLKTFAASDPVDYNEINDNYVKIDTGVKNALQGRAAYNLLDNSDFRNPVNQRGIYDTTESENLRYTIDRWKSYLTSIDVSQTGMLLSGQYGSNYNTIYQYVPLTPDGRTYTAALYYADGTVKCASGDFLTIAGGIGPEYGVLFEKDSGGNPYVQLYTYSGKRIIGAALYEGAYTADTLPAYVPKDDELAECQRQYFPVFKSETTYAYWTKADGDTCKIYIPSPKMRVNPTPVLYDGGCTVYLAGNSTWSNAVTLQYYGYAQGCNVFSFASPSTYFETGKTYLYRGIKALSAEM